MNILVHTILLLFLICVSGKLRVMKPDELYGQFTNKNNSLPYSVANFGHIPWGRKLIGSVMLANPFDACSPIQPNPNFENEKPFVLIMRGNCSFVTKVRNAQMAGASLAVIMDSAVEMSETIFMGDDGFGYTVQIPSVFIREQDGEIIEKYIRDFQGKAPKDSKSIALPEKQVVMVMKFHTVKTEIISVMLALTLHNRETFKLLREFEPYYKLLKNDKVEFSVYYEIFQCPDCYSHNFTIAQEDCLGGGLYCQLDPDGETNIGTGRHVVQEQLRQVCIYRADPDKWFTYMDLFDQEAMFPQTYEQKSSQLQRKLGIDEAKVSWCQQDSFNQSFSDRWIQRNKILDDQSNFRYSSGIRFYPGAVINNQTYLGAIDASDIFGEICNSMITQTSYCKQYVDQEFAEATGQSGDSNIAIIILFVILVMVIFFLFMVLYTFKLISKVFIYRRMVRKEMSREMSTQVNQMVSQYISFYEAKDKKGNQV